MPGRQRDDQVAMERHRGWGPDRDQPAIRPARERRDAAFDLARVAHADRGQLHTERRRRGLDRGETTGPGGNRRIANNRRSRHARRDFFEQLQQFPAHAVFERDETGGVAAGPRQARNQAAADRISGHEHDRHGAARLLQSADRGAGCGQDDVGRERDQLRRVADGVGVAGGLAVVDAHIAADRPAQFLQPLRKGCDATPRCRIVGGSRHERADPPHAIGSLRARRDRPSGRRTGEHCDEFASFHRRCPPCF